MEFSVEVDTIKSGWSIVCFEGLHVNVSKKIMSYRHVKFLKKKCGTMRGKSVIFKKNPLKSSKCFLPSPWPMSTDVVNPSMKAAEMLTANLAVCLLLAPAAGHNPVKRSCIFCIKIRPASIQYSFFAGLIPGDDSRFAIFVGFIKLYSRLDYLYLYYSVYIQALN